MEIYKCDVCGNVVDLLYNGGGTLVCCGQDMTLLVVNEEETVFEKHIPKVIEEGNKIVVQVGETIHPMEASHYIEWIALVTDKEIIRQILKPGDEPKASFNKPNDNYEVLAYCNVHGLYKK